MATDRWPLRTLSYPLRRVGCALDAQTVCNPPRLPCGTSRLSTSGVAIFGVITAVLLGMIGFLGLTTVCWAIGLLLTIVAVALLAQNWKLAEKCMGGRGTGARRIVIGVVCAIAFVSGFVPWLIRCHGVAGFQGTLWFWRGLAVTAAGMVGTWYASSLVDWSWVRPRLRGMGKVSQLPCQTSTSQTWRHLTQVWLTHRIAAYIVGRIGVLVGIALLIISFHPKLTSSAASAAATVVAALAIFYLNRVVPIGALVTNPPIQVGDKVVLAEEFGTGIARRPVYYVVDVAVEGVKLVELDQDDQPLEATVDRGHDRSLSLTDVGKLLRARQRFSGCGAACSKANEYCPLGLGKAAEESSLRSPL